MLVVFGWQSITFRGLPRNTSPRKGREHDLDHRIETGSCDNRGGVLSCGKTVPRCIGGATKETLCTGTTRYTGNGGADGSSLAQLGSYVRAADTLKGYSTGVAS